jgi:anti-sigma factor RsiW
MNCDVDLKGYLLEELPRGQRSVVSAHVAGCAECREELGRLRGVQAAMMALREEEPPRRIAFVSDKVFEPRWWERVFGSGPAMGLASAALLAGAILAHGALSRPAAAPVAGTAVASQAAVEREVEGKLDGRVKEAVARAVADVEARQEQKTAELLAASERRFAEQRRADLIAFDENTEILYKRMARVVAQNDGPAMPAAGARP